MNVAFLPSRLAGNVVAPPSKSIAHRLLLCAGLAAGESIIDNIALSEDIAATLRCLAALGVQYEIDGARVRIVSSGLPDAAVNETLPCSACGSTLRFFLPLCMLLPGETKLGGTQRLLSRPLSVYEDICKAQKILFRNDGAVVTVGVGLHSGVFIVPGNVSSQFVSGLLFSLPLLPGDSEIRLTETVESRPYIDLTLDALRRFGVSAFWRDDRTLAIPGRQRYQPVEMRVEGDWSNAAFWFALQSFGHAVSVSGLNERSLQGDRLCVEFLRRIRQGQAPIDLADCPDLGPVLMAAAALCGNGGVFTGTRRLKIKESDRGAAMAEELGKCGIKTAVSENRIEIFAGTPTAPKTPVCAHEDHRIVMALSLLLLQTGGEIAGAEAVNKSYPDFFSQLARLGAKLQKTETETENSGA